MSNFNEALAVEIERLRKVLKRILDTPGNDVERLKQIARDALERTG